MLHWDRATVLLVALSGLILVALATPAAALPADEPPVTFPEMWGTELVLHNEGFLTARVSYRIRDSQDVVVKYDGDGPENALEGIRQIEPRSGNTTVFALTAS